MRTAGGHVIPAGGKTEETCTKVPKKYPEHMKDKVLTYDQDIQNIFDTVVQVEHGQLIELI